MEIKTIFKIITLMILVIMTTISCTKKQKTIEDYDIKEVLNHAIDDFDNNVLQSDCDYLSTIDISKKIGEKELSVLIDKRLMHDKDTTYTRIIKNNMITFDDIKLDLDQEEYRVVEDGNIYYYQKNIKNEIVFPFEKFNISKLMDDKNNIVWHLFGLTKPENFVIEKVTKANKDNEDNNVLTLKGKLNSIELLDNLSTEFISSKTTFLNDIDFDTIVVVNEVDGNFRYKSMILNSISQDIKFNITVSFEMKDLDVYIKDDVLNADERIISYDEYIQKALIDSEDETEIYEKLSNFTNEFYDLYDKKRLITGEKAKELGEKYLASKKGKYFDVRDQVFAMDDYWNEKAKDLSYNKDEDLKNLKNLFSGELSGADAIDKYKLDPSTFSFNTTVDNGMYKIGIYSDLSIDCEDKYGFPIFDRTYECISIYTNDIGIKTYEFKSTEDRNDIYKYIKFIEDEHYYNEYKKEVMIFKLSDEQGEHYFDDKDAFHIYMFKKEDSYEYAEHYIIDFIFDMYQSKYYDIILNKVEEVLEDYK